MKHPNNQVILSGKLYNFRSFNNIIQKKYIFPKSMPSGLQSIWGYINGTFFQNNQIETINYNVEVDENGYFTFGDGKYIDIEGSSISGNNPRTFIFQVTLLTDYNKVQFIDAGTDSSDCLFSLGWGMEQNKLFYHFSYDDNTNIYELITGNYIIAFVYDSQNLYIYVDGRSIHSSEHWLNTYNSNYRIGNYGPDTAYGSIQGKWKSNFCAVYDRALTENEIKKINNFINFC